MSSTALGNSSLPASDASPPTGHHPAKARCHVAFFLDGEEVNENAKSHTTRASGRWGGQSTMTAYERRAWNARVAESDALRQRALQCGEDIARVASGLGYEVVAHTPTAFLRPNAAAPVTVTKPDVELHCFGGADGTPNHVVESAAPPSLPPSEFVPELMQPVFLEEDALDSCSSRSSSPGTEEQVGLVPVLTPLLRESETELRRLLDDGSLCTYGGMLPRALSSRGSSSHYSLTEMSTNPLQDNGSAWRDNNDDRSSSFGLTRANLPTVRAVNASNRQATSSVNSLGRRSTPSTTQSSPNASPSPRQSATPLRAMLARYHGDTGSLLSNNPNVFQVRASMMDVTSSRGTSNVNASVSMEHLNGLELQAVGTSQNTNRLLTPATDVLNTPAVRVTDDEISPRLYGRPIQ